MSKDINVTDGTVLETLNNKVDLDGGNYVGSGLEDIIEQTHISSKITNCITEVPQRIKLELNNGTLTLKAGSIVTVPNGFEANGTTPKFDYMTVESDISISPINYASSKHTICVHFGNSRLQALATKTQTFSGSSAPTVSSTYAFWYDTASNIVKATGDSGGGWEIGWSLPISIVDIVKGTGVTSIDQIFNGMGYIGSTVWVDKGVKALLPNGRNEDGTLRNVEITTSNVFTQTATWVSDNIIFSIASGGIGRWGGNDVYYNEYDNFNYFNGSKIPHCFIGTFAYSNGITSFQPKQPFRAVDYGDCLLKTDKAEISGWGMPSSKYIDLTLGASGTSYTAPANGWVFISANVSQAGGYVQIYKNIYSVLQRVVTADTTAICLMPVKKGEAYNMYYTSITKTNMFRFIYAEGEQ